MRFAFNVKQFYPFTGSSIMASGLMNFHEIFNLERDNFNFLEAFIIENRIILFENPS